MSYRTARCARWPQSHSALCQPRYCIHHISNQSRRNHYTDGTKGGGQLAAAGEAGSGTGEEGTERGKQEKATEEMHLPIFPVFKHGFAKDSLDYIAVRFECEIFTIHEVV